MGATGSAMEIRQSLARLSDEDVQPTEHAFWEALWQGPRSALDVFSNIGPRDVRKLIKTRPGNVKTLIWQAVHQLVAFVDAPNHTFHTPALNCVRLLTRIMPFLFEDLDNYDAAELRAFVEEVFWTSLSAPAESSAVEPDASQTLDKKSNAGADQAGEAQAASMPANTTSTTTANPAAGAAAATEKDSPRQPSSTQQLPSGGSGVCLAHRLLSAILRLLFIPGFTIDEQRFRDRCRPPPRQPDAGAKTSATIDDNMDSIFDPGHVWDCGVGLHVDPSAGPYGANARLEGNRNEVIKLMLTCFCQQLYVPPRKHPVVSDRWLGTFCSMEHSSSTSLPHHRPSRLQGALLYSLMNVVLSYEPVGSGLMSMLPWASSVMEDPREEHIDNAVHALLILLDFAGAPPPSSTANATADHPSSAHGHDQTRDDFGADKPAPTAEKNSTIQKPDTPQWPENAFIQLLRGIKDTADFEIIFAGFSRLLNNVHEAENTYLPSSIKQIRYHQELLVLFWKCIDINPLFRQYCLATADRVKKLVVPLLFLMCRARKDAASAGQVHICTFILLHLSGDRNFGVALNRLLEAALPLPDLPKLRVAGTQSGTTTDSSAGHFANHADLMILVFHKVIVDGLKSLSSLYNCLLTVISNVSPYLKTMSLIGSLKLVKLFEVFTSTRFLMSGENNHQFTFFLLDIFNNLIQYQYGGNSHLVYAMVRRKQKFDRLVEITLPPSAKATVEEKGTAVVAPSTEENGDAVGNSASTSAEPRGAKFKPTQAWLDAWKSRLPIDTIMRLLDHLKPQIEDMCRAHSGSVDEATVVEFIRETTMVGLLPIPHAIVVRKYQPNKYTGLWFSTFLWGIIFMRQQAMPLWDGGKIKIFSIQSSGGEPV